MIGLCCSNNRMVIFSKMEKKFISQPTRKGPYIYVVLIEVGWDGLKICQVFADFNKRSFLFIFADGGDWGSHSWSYFVDVINV